MKMNKKGFTLMEMLIVIAIIAILIAIAIPTFMNALEKSRQRTDEANARSLKSLVSAEYMAHPDEWGEKVATDTTFYLDKNGQKCGTASAITFTDGDSIAAISNKMTYTSKKYGNNTTTYVEAKVDATGIVTVNCAAVASGS